MLRQGAHSRSREYACHASAVVLRASSESARLGKRLRNQCIARSNSGFIMPLTGVVGSWAKRSRQHSARRGLARRWLCLAQSVRRRFVASTAVRMASRPGARCAQSVRRRFVASTAWRQSFRIKRRLCSKRATPLRCVDAQAEDIIESVQRRFSSTWLGKLGIKAGSRSNRGD